MTPRAEPSVDVRWWLALAGVSALLLAGALVTVALSSVPALPNLHMVSGMAFPVVGAQVVARRPANRVGQLLVVAGASYALGAAATTYTWLGLEVGTLPARDLAAWVAPWAYAPLALLIPVLVAVFPSGRVESAWLRWPLGLGVTVGMVLLVAGGMILPTAVNLIVFGDSLRKPWGVEALAPLIPAWEALWSILPVLIVLTVVDLALRWRKSQGVGRLQMRWFGLGLVVTAVLSVVGVVTSVVGMAEEFVWISVAFWALGFGALPVTIGIAVTRYRLYDIDRLLSRTVTYTTVVTVLATVYAGGVLLVGLLLPRTSDVTVAASTLAVAALFNPLRRRVQAQVDRRFNRARYDTARVVNGFTARLRDEVDLDDLTADLLAAVTATVQPAGASLWLREVER